jgi:hypothetical protein
MALWASTFNRMSRSRLPAVLPRSAEPRFRWVIELTVSTCHRCVWTGAAWQVNEVAKMGAGLYAAEGDYTGPAAIDARHAAQAGWSIPVRLSALRRFS